jgi:hypothetical protein
LDFPTGKYKYIAYGNAILKTKSPGGSVTRPYEETHRQTENGITSPGDFLPSARCVFGADICDIIIDSRGK